MSGKDDPEYDAFCDPDNPRTIKYEDILAASKRIVGQIIKTPCTRAHMSQRLGLELYLKQEFVQVTGCFKERGVRNTLLLLSDDQKKSGVLSASGGNHGIALSYISTQLNIPSTVVMPKLSPLSKITKMQYYGGDIIMHGANLAEATRFAMTLAKEKKMLYINGYDHPNIIEGHGTVGIEIIEQLPSVDAVLVPCGGGSLLAGVAISLKHLKPDIEVYGIETEKTCSMAEAFKKNERVVITIETPLADALAVDIVGVNSFNNANGLVDKMVVVREDWVARAIMHIVEEERLVVEGAGAVGVAALMAGLFPNLKGKNVVCICSGGNVDTTILSRTLERAMAAEGRLVKFKVTVSDRPGGLADLCTLLASIGVTMRDCAPERAWVKGDVFSVQLKVLCETKGWDHIKELIDHIKKKYRDYFFQDTGERDKNTAGTRHGPCLAPNPVCMQKTQ